MSRPVSREKEHVRKKLKRLSIFPHGKNIAKQVVSYSQSVYHGHKDTTHSGECH
jgi:hypothetical protein